MLELKHISFEAGEGGTVKEIIRDVNLTLPDNKFIAVTGPNGGGKSTLAKLIVGIEQPIKGQILLDGEDITGLGITERAKKGVSFAFQQPVRFKGITVRDLIGLAAGENISVPAIIFPRSVCVRRIILTARSMQVCPAVS